MLIISYINKLLYSHFFPPEYPSFLRLTFHSVYIYSTFCLSIYFLMDICIVPTFGCYEKGCCECWCTKYLFEALLLILFLNLNIDDFQHCASFRCTAEWLNYVYISTYIYFFRFFSLIGYSVLQNIEYSPLHHMVGPNWLPIIYIYKIYNNVYMLIPNS